MSRQQKYMDIWRCLFAGAMLVISSVSSLFSTRPAIKFIWIGMAMVSAMLLVGLTLLVFRGGNHGEEEKKES
jgi:hypothetical protein